ncbi:hypothetical protein B2904_orf375 [Brachyspira pilosicoli B2904]|uniref:Glycosyltransferase RgtA/B/C/D-like domain-containing protein n=1 Tax=Brachyspira pilosicoli B2904 TaxID=1133568 RepID=J9UAX8_BRAPL|nr:hypothetical protein [Brachyspira pilosicoli]AFR69731.1 hypothetical protein B2904_orf375 [Brachyspira pilosicoli B2904]
MKNKKILLKIYIIFASVIMASIIILALLGKKERIGYLSEFKINIEKTIELNDYIDIEEFTIDNKLNYDAITNYILTNESISIYSYDFRIKYYDKVFRNSDIYDVYPILNNLPDYVQSAKMGNNQGTPFGNLISTKIIDIEKIDNIKYVLKIKNKLIFYIINITLGIILIYLIINFNDFISFIKGKNIKKESIIYFYALLILIFSISIRIYWATQKDIFHQDEYYTVSFVNYQKWLKMDLSSIKNISGYEILDSILKSDNSIKDCINDIKELYKNTNDPQISNLYYTILRLFFIGTDTIEMKELMIRGAVLNCIFFIIGYIFLYKLLKLLFTDKNEYILFFLFIMSLSPISITFSHFLRPYQMQEMFFVVITYITIYTIYYNKYSFGNLILTSIITGLGYLILTSSMIFVFILSAMLFINYMLTLIKTKTKINFFMLQPLIEIKSYKIILYYAAAFISALLVSRIFYANFFGMLFNNTDRALGTIMISNNLFNFINNYAFNGLLILLLIFMIEGAIIKLLEKRKHINNICNFKLICFIIILSFIYVLLSDLIAPYKFEIRYTGTAYMLLLLLYIIIFLFIQDNNKLKYFILISISLFYIYNITDYKLFSYFYKKDEKLDVLKENMHVYGYKVFYNESFYGYYSLGYLNTNLYYTYIDDKTKLNDIIDNKFYFIVKDLYNKDYDLIFSSYKKEKISSYNGISIFKLMKTNLNN